MHIASMFFFKFEGIIDFIYIIEMGSKKLVRYDNRLLYGSAILNLIAIIVILIIWLKKRKASSEVVSQEINTLIQQTRRQQKTKANNRVQVIDNYREQLRTIPIGGVNKQLINKKIFHFHQVTQTDRGQRQQELIKILQQQLKIQRDRNQLLQQRQQIMETKIAAIQNLGDKIQPEDYQNLKNELEFCQQRLQQAMISQAELRKKLGDYERMSISMLNHPQYQRIRQLNNKYKDTIAELQNHLLLKNESKGGYFDLSFHNL